MQNTVPFHRLLPPVILLIFVPQYAWIDGMFLPFPSNLYVGDFIRVRPEREILVHKLHMLKADLYEVIQPGTELILRNNHHIERNGCSA